MGSLASLRTVRPNPPGDERADPRAAAAAWVDQVMADLQVGVDFPDVRIAKFIREADQRGWAEVALAGLYLEIVRSESLETRDAHFAAIERLLARATEAGDPSMVAIGLARRGKALSKTFDPVAQVRAAGDIARATVLVEGATGNDPTRALAHCNCGVVFGQRDLWELEEEQYALAEQALEGERSSVWVSWAVLYNRAEMQLNWACALRELGLLDEARDRAKIAAEAIRAANTDTMPTAWKKELGAMEALVLAIDPSAGRPIYDQVPEDGEYGGLVHLARAISHADPQLALAEAHTALELSNPRDTQTVHTLAHSIATEIESVIAGHETEGQQYARYLARLRWEARLRNLAEMKSLLDAERLRDEHDLLSRHVYLDELTRLGNRRALFRHIDSLVSRRVTSVAIVVVDVDHFKQVNDTYGHAVGDEALVRLAALLRAAVRADDLAVRMGGDEFMLVLANTDPPAARRRTEMILDAVDNEPWDEVSPGLRVTASAGIAWGDPHALTHIIGTADDALYRSKAAGGNVVSDG